jgi:hypothetical protein
MAGFSTYLQQKVLDHIGGNSSYTAPTPYVGLYTAAPTDAGGGTEVSGGSYARVNANALFGSASGTSMANDGAVTFPAATASWGTVTHFGVFDASSAGNLLYWGALTTSKTIGSGDTASFAVGTLTVSLD